MSVVRREPGSRRGTAKQKHEARLVWLAARPHLYEAVPGINQDVTDAGSARLDALRLEMVARDMFGARSVQTQRETVRRLVSELRGEHLRGGAW